MKEQLVNCTKASHQFSTVIYDVNIVPSFYYHRTLKDFAGLPIDAFETCTLNEIYPVKNPCKVFTCEKNHYV